MTMLAAKDIIPIVMRLVTGFIVLRASLLTDCVGETTNLRWHVKLATADLGLVDSSASDHLLNMKTNHGQFVNHV
jgi:hypothetical protein